MSFKPNLLIVGNYNRKDYIDLFKASKYSFNFFFLEYASRQEIYNSYYKSYGKSILWGDFSDAFSLLEDIQPHKVIFIFIESYFHIALNLACKLKGISTYHLDHGIRDLDINIRLEKQIIPRVRQSRLKQVFTKVTQIYPRIKARRFLNNTIHKLPSRERKFLQQYMYERKDKTFIETFKVIKSRLRIADAYITFSPKTYAVHKVVDHLPANQKVHFVGIPSFDHLFAIKPLQYKSKSIIFIDQGLAARRMFGWNYKLYQLFIKKFASLCKRFGYKIFTKLHPTQPVKDKKMWLKEENVSVISDAELCTQLRSTSLITGFCSTYLLPLAAMPFTCITIFENHPVGRMDVSKSFIDAGVAHPVYDLSELHEILPNIELLHQKQLPNKKAFEENWLYKFDGKAGERLRNILLSDNL